MTYATPEAFKQALEAHVRNASTARSHAVTRVRQLVVFDRFLARVFDVLGERAAVKGGAALELRLDRARTTRDVDLRVSGKPGQLRDALERAGHLDHGDFFSFAVTPDPKHPTIAGDGVVYEGQRFRVEARLAGKVYGDPFGVDAAFGDIITTPMDTLLGNDLLKFAGIAPTRYRVYPRETHVAEKLHAYTLPRERPNTRVKDLPDLALLASSGSFTASTLQRAIEATFAFRRTHPVPSSFPVPPDAWSPTYSQIAKRDGLPWQDLGATTAAVRSFLDPVLKGASGIWDPKHWSWNPLEQELRKHQSLVRRRPQRVKGNASGRMLRNRDAPRPMSAHGLDNARARLRKSEIAFAHRATPLVGRWPLASRSAVAPGRRHRVDRRRHRVVGGRPSVRASRVF